MPRRVLRAHPPRHPTIKWSCLAEYSRRDSKHVWRGVQPSGFPRRCAPSPKHLIFSDINALERTPNPPPKATPPKRYHYALEMTPYAPPQALPPGPTPLENDFVVSWPAASQGNARAVRTWMTPFRRTPRGTLQLSGHAPQNTPDAISQDDTHP